MVYLVLLSFVEIMGQRPKAGLVCEAGGDEAGIVAGRQAT